MVNTKEHKKEKTVFDKALDIQEIRDYQQSIGNYNKNTQYHYVTTLYKIRQKLHKPLEKAIKQDLINLLARLINPLDDSIRAVGHSRYNLYITVMRDYFYRFLRRDYPCPKEKGFERKACYDDEEVMSPDEQRKFFDYLKTLPNPLWKCLFGFYGYGCRRGEGIYIYKKHIDKKKKIVTILPTIHFIPKYMGRKKIDRWFGISEEFTNWIEEYEAVRPKPINPADEPLLFINNIMNKPRGRGKGKKRTEQSGNWGLPVKDWEVNARFKELLVEAGVPEHYHPHHLRSSYITDLLDKGVQMKRVMRYSGHTDIRNLGKYWRISDKRKVVKKEEAEPSFIS